ncbi:M20/M25/M40 family metallo-hydrolase [Streptomyces himalayensis]|uniref:M20/M25/M40 family metallo-hydrolase n=1 Tax=Streptomyces himalayensis subsp. himalayensis TaxID=2756131 RepID=A0A7W0DSR5_9ACTN|nr:M20/M25/M40 family metallo-hydrolase [Streptomyces himalayensis]MBA2950606.1 M20/M25/M40 family metallo-hydrolase [Streptomyces himalayensis subsp. himalayensis]
MTAALDLLTELVRGRTVASGEGVLAALCADLLRDNGFAVSTPGWEEGREQLVARTGSGSTPLTVTGHLDTVPADPEQWSVDPWAAERDGDRVVGRGTSDMKSGVAAALVAAADHAARPHACRGLQVVLTAGEETGCTGALRLQRSSLAPGGPLLVAEPTANRLVPGHKGAHWMRLTAAGRAAHGSAPELGDNAVVRLARAAAALHDHDAWPSHATFGPVTANVGLLRGGVQPNVVPDSAELLLDVRTVPGVDGDDVRAAVAELGGDGVRVDDHVVLPVVDTDLHDPFVGLVREALVAVGENDEPQPPARYFTDASVLARLLSPSEGGVPAPTVVLGPGEPDQCHVVDEWCSASKVEAAVEVYRQLVDRWCSGR